MKTSIHNHLVKITRHAIVPAVALALLAAPAANADDKAWNRSTQANWNLGPWSPTGTPAAGDDIVTPIQFGNLLLNTSPTVNSWSFSGATLWNIINDNTVNDRLLTIANDLNFTGTQVLTFRRNTNGNLSMNIGGKLIANGTENASRLTMGIGSNPLQSLTVTGRTEHLQGATGLLFSGTTVNLNGGLLLGTPAAAMRTQLFTGADASGISFNVAHLEGGNANATIYVNSSGGTAVTSGLLNLNINGNTGASNTFSGVLTDTASPSGTNTAILGITKTGNNTQTLAGTSAYTGATLVSDGTLIVSADKALGDTASLTVSATGTLDVRGSTAGTLTLGAASSFDFSGGTVKLQLGTAFDQIVSSGSGLFSISGGTFELDVTGAGFSYGDTYQVLSGFGGSNSVSGLAFTGFDTSNYTAGLDNAGLLSFAVIPEPSSLALLGISLALFVFLRRKNVTQS